MSSQLKANFVAIGLFATSVCGTFAIFGCVPMLARFTSHNPHVTPTQQFQVFPEVSQRQRSSQSAVTAPPDRTWQVRAIYFFNSRQAEHPPQPRSAL